MLRQLRSVPQRGRQVEVSRGFAQVRLQLAPTLCIQRARSARSLAFAQCVQAALFEAVHPALHCRAVLAKQCGDLAAGLPRRHQQQSVQSVVVARLLATLNLLLDRYSHHLSILDLQLAHRLSPGEKNEAIISPCCIIYVVAFSPGTIDTPILGPLPKEAIAQIVASIPMGRMGSADEIAKVAVFLASDDSSFVTGIELFVDGGTAQV